MADTNSSEGFPCRARDDPKGFLGTECRDSQLQMRLGNERLKGSPGISEVSTDLELDIGLVLCNSN